MTKCKCPKCGNKCNVYNDILGGMIIATEQDVATILIECPECRFWRRFGYNVGQLFEKRDELGNNNFEKFVKKLEKDCIEIFMNSAYEDTK